MGFVTKFFAFWNENPRFVVEEKMGLYFVFTNRRQPVSDEINRMK